jgi:hypothetical protein
MSQATRASDFLAYSEAHFGDPYSMGSVASTAAHGDTHGRRHFVKEGVLFEKPVRSLTKTHMTPAIVHRRPLASELPAPTEPGHTSEFFLGKEAADDMRAIFILIVVVYLYYACTAGNYTTAPSVDKTRNTNNLFSGPVRLASCFRVVSHAFIYLFIYFRAGSAHRARLCEAPREPP